MPPPGDFNRADRPVLPPEDISSLCGENKGLLYILNHFDYVYRYRLCVEMGKIKDKNGQMVCQSGTCYNPRTLKVGGGPACSSWLPS